MNAPETICFTCRAPLDYEDAYEDAQGEEICGRCFDKKIEQAESIGEGER